MQSLLIQGAHVTDPAGGVDAVCDVLSAAGRVVAVEAEITARRARRETDAAALRVVDGRQMWLWPGLVDLHVHLREPGYAEKETFRTGGRAASAGGYTTVVCEPNTDPPTDEPARVKEAAERADAEAGVRVLFKAAMTRGRLGREPLDVAPLAATGRVVALSDDGDPVVNPTVMRDICRAAAENRLPVAPHCEDSPRSLAEVAAGVDPGFVPGEPYTNEAAWVERDIRIATTQGCRIHLSHVSLERSVQAIRRAREQHAGVTWEVTPHHLLLCRQDFGADDVPLVNPPIRSRHDRAALQQALQRGEPDAVASDHAPHTPEDKRAGAHGLIGLETTLALVLTYFVHEGRLSRSDAADLLSHRPARALGLSAGTLKTGARADLVLIDPELEWTVEPAKLLSKSRNTPFAGRRLRGRAVATWVGGHCVFAHESAHDRVRET